ncbi:unnamed protein product [Cylicocyclus nassatus]|uniref:Serpin domain-containing protein n=1 Tax=Cylicocyclus nassatus TaxID=53992 RepID=A0AA36GVD7_CYLNA|nr:unnamed protein product [Cylicocyclus nassatus]
MGSSSPPSFESASMQVSEMNFGLNMLRQTPVTKSMVVSPVSVIFALAMVQLGARNRTKLQINKVIANEATDNAIVSFYSDLFKNITNSPGAQARITNGFFMNKTFSIRKDYARMIAQKFGALIEAYDFRQAANTAKIIDNFVSQKTDGKIENFIKSDAVEGADALIVNAIYFKADWHYTFNKNFTREALFYHSADDKGKVNYMNEYRKNRMYAENEVVQVLSLPYKDTSYSFNIFLPKKRFGIDELRTKLDGATIQNLLSRLKSTHLDQISIPKMKLEKDYDLKKALLAMGVSDLFDRNLADLSGISENHLYASDAKHRAFIEVDEKGTTAAAATRIGIKVCRKRGPPRIQRNFIADHPFIFILTKDKNALFIGQFI